MCKLASLPALPENIEQILSLRIAILNGSKTLHDVFCSVLSVFRYMYWVWSMMGL